MSTLQCKHISTDTLVTIVLNTGWGKQQADKGGFGSVLTPGNDTHTLPPSLLLPMGTVPACCCLHVVCVCALTGMDDKTGLGGAPLFLNPTQALTAVPAAAAFISCMCADRNG